jgi:(E)-4-hydroxy-3-methylbut-2-enyl-diphosphate synthase
MKRRVTRTIRIGRVPIGGGNPVAVQSMTKTDTSDVSSTLSQIHSLVEAGCDIVRLAVPDMEAARALGRIVRSSRIPIIADIHFDWRLAIEAVRKGVRGLRINPGNIGAKWKVREVVDAARARSVPIRIGVNAGSLEKDLLRDHGHASAAALVESAGRHVRILEDMDFTDIKVSLKASDVPRTVEAYRLFSQSFDYPLHIGISEAGPVSTGIVKSSVGLGILLNEGIGDTIRVSLTAPPEEEVRVAYGILGALGLRRRGVEIISCPTCGRCRIDLRALVSQVEERVRHIRKPLKVAVMGCVVNGPGEARDADVGIAGMKGKGLLFKKGEAVRRVPEKELLDALLAEIETAE